MNPRTNPLSWVTSCMWLMPLPGSRFAGTLLRSASWTARPIRLDAAGGSRTETLGDRVCPSQDKRLEFAVVHPRTGGGVCGHATLATAFVLWKTGRVQQGSPVSLSTSPGSLSPRQDGAWIDLDFPAEPAHAIPPVTGLEQALGTVAVFTGKEPVRPARGVPDRFRCLRLRARHGSPCRPSRTGHHGDCRLRSPRC